MDDLEQISARQRVARLKPSLIAVAIMPFLYLAVLVATGQYDDYGFVLVFTVLRAAVTLGVVYAVWHSVPFARFVLGFWSFGVAIVAAYLIYRFQARLSAAHFTFYFDGDRDIGTVLHVLETGVHLWAGALLVTTPAKRLPDSS